MLFPGLLALFPLQPVVAAAGETALFQDDTLVIRKGKIDIEHGVLTPGADTIIIQIDSASLFDIPTLGPQEPLPTTLGELLAEADAKRKDYDFSAALAAYQAALGKADGEQALARAGKGIMMARNGMTLSESCRIPAVVAKQKFSLKDFYLFYPLEGGSWKTAPNALDPAPDSLVHATYFPRETVSTFFSMADADGFRNLYWTEASGKEWTAPRLLDEHLLSQGNEIYPMLSPDGWTLYFASDGLYGMGGYDLYYSVRADDGSWGEPVNMGFPFSSPGDDFLLMDTPDGKYTLFASNRECSADSVYLYVLEQNRSPLVRPVTDPAGLRALCSLSPTADPTRIDAASAISEEMGGIFAVCLILCCMCTLILFINIAMQIKDKFFKLVALGLGTAYGFQVFVTIGGVTRFIPSTGVTLPLISYGGSSLLATLMVFAIIQGLYILRTDEGVSNVRKKKKKTVAGGEQRAGND